MSEEEWVKAAMADDSMVVELLVRLNHSSPLKTHSSVLPLDWSVRQRRSKPVLVQAKKFTTRDSPTTPLSWSGATSFSGGGCAVDGFEESSQHLTKRSDVFRSKGTGTSETTTTKRTKKKKTLSELREEENLLLKERRHLTRELATLSSTLEKQRATNESLKRMKLCLVSEQEPERVEGIPDQSQKKITASELVHIFPPIITGDTLPNSCLEIQKEAADKKTKVVLPDLNLPIEEDSNFEVLYGMS